MHLSPQLLLLAGALLAGCNAAAVSPPHVYGTDSHRVVKRPTAAQTQRAEPSEDDVREIDARAIDLREIPTLSAVQGAEQPASPSPQRETAGGSTLAKDSTAKDGLPRYTVRRVIAAATVPTIPPVLLSGGHARLCVARVGDAFPALNLPMLGGQTTELATLRGQQATVVLFWHPDRWMARTALTDMQRDIASQFDAKQVAVVGIAVRLPPEAVQVALSQAGATFPQLLDTDGQAFSKVGTATFPRIYVLDPAGKIIWFDIEYSEGTRRELWQTLRYLTKQ